MRKRGIPDTRGHELAGAAVAAASVATKHRRLGSHDEMRSVALALTTDQAVIARPTFQRIKRCYTLYHSLNTYQYPWIIVYLILTYR